MYVYGSVQSMVMARSLLHTLFMRCCILRDRYQPMDLFALVPALSLQTDPVLTQLDHLLDDDTLFQAVKADLLRRYPRTATTGWPSTPVEVVMRMLIVKHLYNWSSEHTE